MVAPPADKSQPLAQYAGATPSYEGCGARRRSPTPGAAARRRSSPSASRAGARFRRDMRAVLDAAAPPACAPRRRARPDRAFARRRGPAWTNRAAVADRLRGAARGAPFVDAGFAEDLAASPATARTARTAT